MANLKYKPLILALLLNNHSGLACFYSGQERDKPVQIGVNVVSLDVSVTDARRRFVPDLEARDFVVTEDGIDQEIDSFARGRGPTSIGAPTDRGRRVTPPQAATAFRSFAGYRFISIVVDNSTTEATNRDSVAK